MIPYNPPSTTYPTSGPSCPIFPTKVYIYVNMLIVVKANSTNGDLVLLGMLANVNRGGQTARGLRPHPFVLIREGKRWVKWLFLALKVCLV